MTTVVMAPGLDNAGSGHWMTELEARFTNVVRVEQDDWSQPSREAWVKGIAATLERIEGEVLLVGHSCGAVAIAQWSAHHFDPRVIAALLIAPADVESESAVESIHAMRPLPRQTIPYPSLVISSDGDPHISPAKAQEMARWWGSEYRFQAGCGHFVAETGFGFWPELETMLNVLAGRMVLQR